MKKAASFIFLTIFLSIFILFLPSKVFALDCSGGINGRFVDENGNLLNLGGSWWNPQGVRWTLKTNNIKDPGHVTDRLIGGLSDNQGSFQINADEYNTLNGNLVLSWMRNGYLSGETTLTQCTVTIKLTPDNQETNPNPKCTDPCNNNSDCAGATDGCTFCFDNGLYKSCVHQSISGGTIDVTCNSGEGINTALGCIPKKPAAFVKYLLNFAIGIGGGIAFLLIIFGGFQIILSGGNPDRVKAGKEMITAALAGLLLIIFSVFILRIIGYDILRLKGFSP